MFQEFVNRTRPRRSRLDVGPQVRRPAGHRHRPPVPGVVLRVRARGRGPDRPRAAHGAALRAASCIRCSSASCASTSPKRRAISRSRASTCAPTCRRSAGGDASAIAIQAPLHPRPDGIGDDAAAAHARAQVRHPEGRARRGVRPTASSRGTDTESLRKVRSLLAELGLVTPMAKRLWKTFGIWEKPASASTRSARPGRLASGRGRA